MAVKIRLKRMGKIRAPHYRIVVADSRTKRDGRVIEEIGKYHPKEEPSFIEVNSERARYWLGVGAQPSEPVAAILKVTGDWQRFRGEPAPEPMRVAEPRRNKTDIFNDALKDAQSEPKVGAVTARKTAARKPPAVDEAPVIEAAAAEPAVAETSPVTDAASADDAIVKELPGTEPVEDSAAAPAPVDTSESADDADSQRSSPKDGADQPGTDDTKAGADQPGTDDTKA